MSTTTSPTTRAPRAPISLEEKLRRYTRAYRGHRVWLGQTDKNGYPVLRRGGRQLFAHRLAFELANGSLDGARLVNECGVRHCTNPEHWRKRDTNPEHEVARVCFEDAFWARTVEVPETSCLLWAGYSNDGYGQVNVPGGGIQSAHRVGYELTHGPLPADARLVNLCSRRNCVHPSHWRMRGSPEEEFLANFRARIVPDPETSCELWTGYINAKGYGRYGQRSAHRISYELQIGPLPDGQPLHHTCPSKHCVRVSHLIPTAGPIDHADAHRQERAINAGAENGRLCEEAKALPRASEDEVHVHRIGAANPPAVRQAREQVKTDLAAADSAKKVEA